MSIDMMLKGHELFASLNVDEIDQLSTFSSVKEFKADETIFEYNQPSSHFYMLMEGLVYLQLAVNPQDYRFAISKVEKGQLFGISSLLKSRRYTSTAQCYEDTKALSIEAKPFWELLQLNCPAGLNIINQVAHIYYTRYLDVIKKLQDVANQITLIS
jgi:signal-transduction protein with cAMP-binding, CBS, and nucleotidyltransferase domain